MTAPDTAPTPEGVEEDPCFCVWTWLDPSAPMIEVVSPNCPRHADDALAALAADADQVDARHDASTPQVAVLGAKDPATRTQSALVMHYVEGWLHSADHMEASDYLRAHIDEIADQMVEDECARDDADLAAERAAHDTEEVVALREAVALLTRWQIDAREALAAVKDRMDEHAYDELATVLDDGVSDHLGEPYAPAERAADESVALSARQRAGLAVAALAAERAAHEGLRAAVEAQVNNPDHLLHGGLLDGYILADPEPLRAALDAGVRGE